MKIKRGSFAPALLLIKSISPIKASLNSLMFDFLCRCSSSATSNALSKASSAEDLMLSASNFASEPASNISSMLVPIAFLRRPEATTFATGTTLFLRFFADFTTKSAAVFRAIAVLGSLSIHPSISSLISAISAVAASSPTSFSHASKKTTGCPSRRRCLTHLSTKKLFPAPQPASSATAHPRCPCFAEIDAVRATNVRVRNSANSRRSSRSSAQISSPVIPSFLE